jgi:RNA polymerase sigma factor (sigma-70 family)
MSGIRGTAGAARSISAATGPESRESRAARGVEGSRQEPEQFGIVFSEYFAEIHGYAARRLGPDAADDIAAATFETAFWKRDGFDPAAGTVRAWLYGIATRHISRCRRDEARRYRAMERVPALVPTAGPEDAVTSRLAAKAELRHVAGVLAAMAEGDRDVVLLVALADLSLAEVGFALGIPYGTAGSRLHRARRLIRERTGLEHPRGRSQTHTTSAQSAEGLTDG